MIVVIFLAHKGVSQPHLWEEWMSSSPTDISIRFYAYTNPILHRNYSHSQEFCDKYRPRDEDGNAIFLGPTQWGSFSLVYETLKAWSHVCHAPDADPNELVFLVSGDDIPIRSAQVLLQPNWRNKDFVCHKRSSHQDIWHHAQWMGLRISTIRKILRRVPLDNVDRLVDMWKRVLEIEPKLDYNISSDELFLYVLNQQQPRMPSRCISFYLFAPGNVLSPIEWKSFLGKRKVSLREHDIKLNLHEVLLDLEYNRMGGGDYDYILFFRKVMPSCSISIELIYKIWDGNLRFDEIRAQGQHEDQQQKINTSRKSRKQVHQKAKRALATASHSTILQANFVQENLLV